MLKVLDRYFGARRWLPAVLWAVVILTVSSLPHFGLPGGIFKGCDKIAHFIEYAILGRMLRYWSRRRQPQFIAGGVGLAAVDELHQGLIPGRQVSEWDFMADLAGLIVGYLVGRTPSRE